MEKVRPWCGQPSDRGRLKNRTEQGGSAWIIYALLPLSSCKNLLPYFFHGAFAPSFIWRRRPCIHWSVNEYNATRRWNGFELFCTALYRRFAEGGCGESACVVGRSSSIEARSATFSDGVGYNRAMDLKERHDSTRSSRLRGANWGRQGRRSTSTDISYDRQFKRMRSEQRRLVMADSVDPTGVPIWVLAGGGAGWG